MFAAGWTGARADDPPPVAPAPGESGKPLPFTGVNLSGAEFGPISDGKPQVYGKNYTYPTAAELAYFAGKGMNVIRLPFHWENLQPALKQKLDPTELGRLRTVVKQATGQGLTVLIDPHNYARYHGKVIGGPEVSDEDFADFWGRLAGEFRDDARVWFGLVNEPHGEPAEQWLASANAAIAAIRRAGAHNLILVPGTDWTGAHSWIKSGNAAVMPGVQDPEQHCVIEVHQYLDADCSGSKRETVSPTIGSERLREFTLWCREHGQKAFLGEFAAGDTVRGAEAIQDMLRDMEKNRDVWTGWAWWSAGPWWGDYMYSLEPKNGVDSPLMRWLVPHLQPAGAEAAATVR